MRQKSPVKVMVSSLLRCLSPPLSEEGVRILPDLQKKVSYDSQQSRADRQTYLFEQHPNTKEKWLCFVSAILQLWLVVEG